MSKTSYAIKIREIAPACLSSSLQEERSASVRRVKVPKVNLAMERLTSVFLTATIQCQKAPTFSQQSLMGVNIVLEATRK